MALGRYIAWSAGILSALALTVASFYPDEIKRMPAALVTALKAEKIERSYERELKHAKSRKGYSLVFLLGRHYYPEEVESRMKGLEEERVAGGWETLILKCDAPEEKKAAREAVKDVFGLDTVPNVPEKWEQELFTPQFFVIRNGEIIGHGTHYTDGEISFSPDEPYTLSPGEEWVEIGFVFGCGRGHRTAEGYITVAEAGKCVEEGIRKTNEMGVSERRGIFYDGTAVAVRREDISNCLKAAEKTSEGGEGTVRYTNAMRCLFAERRNPGEAPVDLEDMLLHPEQAINYSKTSPGWEQKPVFSEEGEIIGSEDCEYLKRRKSQKPQ